MKKIIYTFFLCFFTIAFIAVIALWFIFSANYKRQLLKEKRTYNKIQNTLIKENTWKDTTKIVYKNKNKEKLRERQHKKKKNHNNSDISKIPDVDFNSLRNYNKDIYAWLQIPEVNISYPVLQHEKLDNYYLTHNLDNSFGYPGCIFSETQSKKDFSDALTVLYGHNMKNGSMFGMLHRFDNTDFSKEQYYIHIITPVSKIQYKIMASAVWGAKNIPSSFSNSTEGLINLLNSVRLNLSYKNSTTLKKRLLSEKQQMLVLSTCGSNSNSRFLIIALKQNEWRK